LGHPSLLKVKMVAAHEEVAKIPRSDLRRRTKEDLLGETKGGCFGSPPSKKTGANRDVKQPTGGVSGRGGEDSNENRWNAENREIGTSQLPPKRLSSQNWPLTESELGDSRQTDKEE